MTESPEPTWRNEFYEALRETSAALGYVVSSLPVGQQKTEGMAILQRTTNILENGQSTIPSDVRNLVVAAREVLDVGHMGEEFTHLDQAVEAFSERVPYENDPNREG